MRTAIMLIMLLLVSGCAVTYVCQDGSVVKDAKECKIAAPVENEAPEETIKAPEPAKETPPVVVKKDISPEVQEILDGAKTIKSLTYMYYSSENERLGENFYIKGDIIKRKLADVVTYYERSFDTIYMNTKTKTAESYCEKLSKKCPDRNQAFEVRLDDFYVKTPFDWTNEIVYARVITQEDIDNKPVTVIAFKSQTQEGKMWLRGRGVPMKVQVGNRTYEFGSLVVDSLTDADVTHQTLENAK
jgi:hypothetical protein